MNKGFFQRMVAFIKSHLKLLLIIGLGIGLLVLISQIGFLHVTVQEAEDGEVSYQFYRQETRDTITKTKSRTVKKLVRKGSYEVIVTDSQGKSGFLVVDTKGFLRKTSQTLDLKQELGREFIGNNPGNCTHYNGKLLLSYQCNGSAENMTKHVPATKEQSTYTRKNPAKLSGEVNGVIENKEGVFIVTTGGEEVEKEEDHDYDAPEKDSLAILHKVDQNYNALTSLPITVGVSERPHIASYGAGFIMYDNDYTKILFFDSTKSKPVEVKTKSPNDKTLLPSSIRINKNNGIVTIFSNDFETPNETKASGIKNDIVLTNKDGSRLFSINNKFVTTAVSCGQERLCIISNRSLEVMKISGSVLIPEYKISDVDAVEADGNEILVIRSEEIIRLNTESKKGNIEYRFGGYKFCGFRDFDAQGYTICLTNPAGKNIALHLTNNSASDGIDQKVARLLYSPDISNVSIYKNFISVTPDLSKIKFNKTNNIIGLDPEQRKRINDSIASSAFDTKKYTITTLLDSPLATPGQ